MPLQRDRKRRSGRITNQYHTIRQDPEPNKSVKIAGGREHLKVNSDPVGMLRKLLAIHYSLNNNVQVRPICRLVPAAANNSVETR